MQVLACVGLTLVLVDTVGFVTEDSGAGSKVMDIEESAAKFIIANAFVNTPGAVLPAWSAILVALIPTLRTVGRSDRARLALDQALASEQLRLLIERLERVTELMRQAQAQVPGE